MSEQVPLHQRIARREPGALTEFYRTHGGLVTAVAKRYGRSQWDAEEILQDVAWTVHRKASTFRGTSAFSSWVYRVALNATRMHIRRARRAPTPLEDGALRRAMESGSSSPSPARPDEIAPARQLEKQLADTFRSLKPLDRAIYRGIDLDDDDRRELAGQLGLTLDALKSRLHRSRRAMRAAATMHRF